ncbi:hypothetical protein [Micromonospora sp. NPDC047187]|uniref:hypothetical protein n=1 Tax=Micromonospora sp. NPDC047187 TaxID=3155262 RepID=UPI00340C37EE
MSEAQLESARLERQRYDERYAARVSFWHDPQPLSPDPSFPRFKIQNRSPVPVMRVHFLMSGDGRLEGRRGAHPPGDPRVPGSAAMTLVYQWDSGRYFELPAEQRQAVDAFVRAHGIHPNTVLVGNALRVRQESDGRARLHTWRAVRDDNGRAQVCPHCPACLKQEEIEVDLAVPVLDLPGAYLLPESGVPVAVREP